MTSSETSKEVESYLLNKSAKKGDWNKVNEICEENKHFLSEQDMGLWIRSKFMIKDYQGCYDLCLKIIPKKRSLLKEKCRFMLRSSIKLANRDIIEKSINYYEKIFPDNIDYKLEKIKILYSENNLEDCLSISETVLDSEPSNIIALKFNARSKTKISTNKEDIRMAWQSLIDIDPSNLEAINNLARVFISEENLREASEQLDKLFQLSPNYVPGMATLSKLKQASNKLGFESEIISQDNYRTLYSERKYLEVIEILGGIKAVERWSEDEATFVFRSLSRLERFEDSVILYNENEKQFSKFPRILVEVSNSSNEINDGKTKNSVLSILNQHSKSDITTAKLFLQSIISSREEPNYFASIFEELFEIYGNPIMEFAISLILKERKYEIFSLSKIFEGATSLLDPIHGTLRNKIGDAGVNTIFSQNQDNYIQALLSDESRFTPSQTSFMNSCLELDLPYLVSEISEVNPEIIESPDFQLSEISDEDLESYCDLVRSHALDFSEIELDPDSIILCSNSEDSERYLVSQKKNLSKISIFSNQYKKTGIIKEIGPKETQIESEISSDPRLILGRFFFLLDGLRTVDKMAISWISSTIFSSQNSEIWFDSSLPHGKIAATLLGFPEDRILLIPDN